MKRNGLLAIAALALSLAFIGAYATAAGSQPSTSYQVQTDTISEMLGVPACPAELFLVFSMKYPKNTGNAQVDAFFKKYANETLEGYKEYVASFDEETCSFDKMHAFFDIQAHKSNPQTLGILQILDYYAWMRGGKENKSFNFDLRTGREIEIKDLFINPAIGISGIYGIAYADLCNPKAHRDVARSVFGGECGRDRNAPRELLALSGSLDALGHLVLTERGASINFNADDIWYPEQGDYTISIPKDKLLKFGAKDFWGP